ncbi:lipocalin family protein [Chitinophaga sp. Ak27]|uniref:lipocalin family protein n=1 Tax=Chitinophaga sp. Ak27 TaxID=2726116 RepID=UPI00145F88AE|nr:lipocalin family protein [Chitinophaga sp. Ak27]NLU92439.1 lipocalin family protein [Chitinophaga sp. Ak27]
MTTITTKWALMVLVAGSLLFSCKKEKSSAPTPTCSVNMVNISGTYKLTSLQYKSSTSTTPVEETDSWEPCEKDDIIILKSDGIYDFKDQGTVCNPSGNEHGTWALKGNTLTSNGILKGTITSFDCKTMVYVTENVLVQGDKYTFTMVKQ